MSEDLYVQVVWGHENEVALLKGQVLSLVEAARHDDRSSRINHARRFSHTAYWCKTRIRESNIVVRHDSIPDAPATLWAVTSKHTSCYRFTDN